MTCLITLRHHTPQMLLDARPRYEARVGAGELSGGDVVLAVEAVSKSYMRGREKTTALEKINLSLRRGESLGLVGESGSGKSTLARCVIRLLEPDSGSINLTTGESNSVQFAKQVQMVFQDPYSSLNPRMRIGDALIEVMRVHNIGETAEKRTAKS